MRPLTAPSGKAITLGPVHPNAGTEVAYRKRLLRLVEDMQASTLYWITAYYRANTPEMAQDASPAKALIRLIKGLGRRWLKRFNVASQEMAEYFATAASERADGAMRDILKRGGFTVSFQPSRSWNDVKQAVIAENVSLIKTIHAKHFSDIEQMVMRSVQQGGDLKQLTDDLQQNFHVTRWRAAFIARDQTRKATAVITKLRQEECGIEEAIWLHSGGGASPRPEHVKWGKERKRYKISTGMWSEVDQCYVWPGTAINCRCVPQAIVPGYDP